ncbi:hypothetical protein PGT21_001675 [Puccinia graminis f. sp. tritici]|uniref:Uncharacterized protein n=3 Tax=Puccinia graminis f. sp. tritici TaxID=56615 RepID=A0A5B0MVZ8_PUCGR|nr:hypothetical protein PGT21_001675 [Puccinia graminis f. sp. tritici]
MMSARSSTWSESAASELDPLFLSLKEPAGTPRRTRSRPSLNPLPSPSTSSDSPLPIPATVNFPLPPRRLRPGELIGIPDPAPTSSISPADRPDPFLAPVSLYGVAIGGNNPIKTNPAVNGRAEVKTAGLTSLDLRKMSLRNRSSASISHPPCPPPETISLRARNPSRMLAPHTPSLHSPPRSYSHNTQQQHPPRYQQAFSASTSNLITTPSVERSVRSSSRPSLQSSLPPRNLSLVETSSNPIPRLPPTRLAYQSLSYNLSTTPEPFDHSLSSIRQPLSESLSTDLNNFNPNPQLRRHPLLSASPIPPQNASDSLAIYSGMAPITDRSNGRIKFAPLPNKPGFAGPSVIPSLSLFESQNTQPKQQNSSRKAAWIQRWLMPATKPLVSKPKPDISLPVPDTLILTGTGAAPSSALVTAPAVRRRSSVNDQQTPAKPVVKPQRPRSRSFSTGRPTLGMVANLVRTPSRSLHETVTSGKSLLTGSQCIVTPTRAHSLHNLIGYNPLPESIPNPTSNPQPSILPEASAENNSKILGNPSAEPAMNTIQQSEVTRDSEAGRAQHAPMIVSNEEEAAAAAGGSPKTKKKREIRFRNTLELIPDVVFPATPPGGPMFSVQKDQSAAAPTESSGYQQTSHSDLHAMDLMGSDHKRRKPAKKNLGLFNHLRRPRTADHYGNDPSLGTGRGHHQEPGRRTLQPLIGSSSLPHPVIQPMAALLPGKTRHNNNQQLAFPDEDGVNLLSRKLAPKINLTFVDLDHHIGSRFSVNTLLKEVHKSVPEVKPHEDSDHDPQEGSTIGESSSRPTRIENPGRQYSDPVTRKEMELQSRGRQGSESEVRSEGGRDGGSSDNLGSPTTATTSVSNPTEIEIVAEPVVTHHHHHHHHSNHDSIIEVVKSNGADVVFQMVVPVVGAAPAKQRQPVAPGQPERRPRRNEEAVGRQLEVPEMAHEEDALTEISERLDALNRSIEAQEGQHSRAQTPDNTVLVPVRQSPSFSRAVLPGAARRKTKRIESWLSNVPSPQTSPVSADIPFPRNHHIEQLHYHNQLLLPNKLHQEVLDHPDLLDCPESPIDKLHRHLPSRLGIHKSSRSPTPTRS